MYLGQYWAKFGPTTLFVLLWSSGAIFSRWGLDNGSSFAILTWRFIIALAFLSFFVYSTPSLFAPKRKSFKNGMGRLIDYWWLFHLLSFSTR